MSLRVSGKGVEIGTAFAETVEGRVAGALAKYFDGGASGHVVLERDGTGYRTACVLHLDSGVSLEASGLGYDAYASFEQTAERIEKQLRRYKRRLRTHGGRAATAAGDAGPGGEAGPKRDAGERAG